MNQIRRLLLAMCVAASPLAITGCSFLDRKEAEVRIYEVPPSVRTAIENVMAGGRVKSIERIERRDNVVIYELEYIRDGQQLHAYFAADGTQAKGAQ